MREKKFLILSVILITILALVGCSKKTDDSANQTKKKVVKKASSGPAIPEADKKAPLVQFDGKLPTGFPDDFPIYEGAKIQGKTQTYGDQKLGLFFGVTWTTDDEPKKVTDFYKEMLHKNGYALDQFEEQKNGLSAFLFPNKRGSVMVTKPNNTITTISANFYKVY